MLPRFSTDREGKTEKQEELELFHQYKRFVFAKTKLYTTDQLLQEDIAQETWISLFRNVETLKQLSCKARMTYIALTVRSSALDYLAKAESRTFLTPEPAEVDTEDGVPSAEEAFLQDNAVSGYGLWDHLSKEDQQLLIGRYIEGLSDIELAQRCNVKPSSIRMMLTRARRRAKRFILAEMEEHDEGK